MSPRGRPLRVVLADDDYFSREGLRGLIESSEGTVVAGEASTFAEALDAVTETKPDVVVMDLRIAGAEPGEAPAALVAAAPDTRVVVLTGSAVEAEVLATLAAGATGFLLKDAPAEDLVAAIRQAANGNTVLAGAAANALLTQLDASAAAVAAAPAPDAATTAALSTRESEVLAMIVDGADNAEIGKALSISRHTVKQHVTNIFDKLGVRSRVEAAVLAVRERRV